MVLPADGYHMKLSDLKTQDLVYRRGAPDTFDVERFKNDLAGEKLALPSFPKSLYNSNSSLRSSQLSRMEEGGRSLGSITQREIHSRER